MLCVSLLITCFYSSISAYDSSGLNTDDIDWQIPLPVRCSPCDGHAEGFAGFFSDTYHLLVTSDPRMEGLRAQTEKQTAHLLTSRFAFPTYKNYQDCINIWWWFSVSWGEEMHRESLCGPHPQELHCPKFHGLTERKFTFQMGPVRSRKRKGLETTGEISKWLIYSR